MSLRFWRLLGTVIMLLCLGNSAANATSLPPSAPQAPMASEGPTPPAVLASVRRIQQALENIISLKRPGEDGYATVWDGNKYVQCGLARGGGLRCEAAGSLMQPSMARLLTVDRTERLALLGWKLNPNFGNYVKVLPANLSPEQDAMNILIVLGDVYGADLTNLQVETDWIASEPCPPRNGPGQNLAGMINDAPAMAPTAVHACFFIDETAPVVATGSATDLSKRYGPRLTGEIGRLRVNLDRQIHVSFNTGIAYMQCEPETSPAAIYCEAESADSWPAISAVLTPDHIAKLHAAGYADPGRAPNYWKLYPLDRAQDADIASEILTLLHDAYGYTGAEPLEIETEKGKAPLVVIPAG